MSIMERLYNGEIHPSEEIVPHSGEYEKAVRAIEEMLQQLQEELKPEEYERIEKLCLDYSTIADHLAGESFIYGLSLGLKLMLEAESMSYWNGETKAEIKK